jgi:Fur family peroxide stress response transcriptional regulator
MKKSAELMQIFRSKGLRVTPQRNVVFEVLGRHAGHPTAEAIWRAVRDQMPTVTLPTTYHILHELVSIGELQQIDLGTGSMLFDTNVSVHSHTVCQVCGRVADLQLDTSWVEIPETQREGFEVHQTEVVVRGVCARCSARGATEDRQPWEASSQGHEH